MKSGPKKRRQSHGSAWHWKQTDSWYYTEPGTKKRIPLLDENGERIRGKGNKREAEIALAREKLTWSNQDSAPNRGNWKVVNVCSEYLQYCERGVANGSVSQGYRNNAVYWLNSLCEFCGAMPLSEFKKVHVQDWIDCHPTWKSSATRRCAIAITQAAFNRAEEMYGLVNPLKGLKKPKENPRLQSISPDDEQKIYEVCNDRFRDFLFAAFRTGLRPFCELARLTADDVEEHDRGMMWRVYSSKTDKPRKIPVRPEVAKLTRELMKSAPKGSGKPLFRNSRDRPWKSTNGVSHYLRVKSKLGWSEDPVRGSYACYTCRHTFVHRMLSGFWNGGVGASIETVAELIGDTPATTFRHYGREWAQHYQEPLWQAIGDSAARSSSSSPQKSTKQTKPGKRSPIPGKSTKCRRSSSKSRGA
ncbi:tyrosine-type recombinase/integrase [Rubinisphaera margarita]|uniref:tyrosine-type recombinase/integrase n=1 Tax=Rubinisphaera margarita TaxID=2909586 RepID=UPI001EE996C3|nr:tyrosine-type recombinase/integrase [Rubinisphaera margarita]MCG6157274.1 tyrosine-type recombinase/integrase [Rubinisphaera margarita]